MTIFNITIVIYGFQGSPDREQTFKVEAPTRWQARQVIYNIYGKGTTISRVVMAGTPFNVKDALGSRNLIKKKRGRPSKYEIKGLDIIKTEEPEVAQLPDRICGNCRFWDWYYCEGNITNLEGKLIAEWGNCCNESGHLWYHKYKKACKDFAADPTHLPEKPEIKRTGRGYYIEWREK